MLLLCGQRALLQGSARVLACRGCLSAVVCRASYSRHLLATADDLSWITFLKSCQTVDCLLSLGIARKKILVYVLLQSFDFGYLRVILVIYVIGHEVNGLEASLYLTQVHFAVLFLLFAKCK